MTEILSLVDYRCYTSNSVVLPLPLGRIGVPGSREHRHTRSPTKPVAAQRRQSGGLRGGVFVYGPDKPQRPRTPIRHKHSGLFGLGAGIEIAVHIGVLVGVVPHLGAPTPPESRLLATHGTDRGRRRDITSGRLGALAINQRRPGPAVGTDTAHHVGKAGGRCGRSGGAGAAKDAAALRARPRMSGIQAGELRSSDQVVQPTGSKNAW